LLLLLLLLQKREEEMVKLVSVRRTRLYGPAAWRDWWEYINAFVYLVATIVLLVGCILLLPGRSSAKLGLILVLVALALLVIVNLHDLIAQLAGFDFRLPLLSLDPQLALIEILAPLLQVLGSILFFIGTILLLEVRLQTRPWVLHERGGLGSFTHMMFETTFSSTRTPLSLEHPPS
jgi:magnesium-transporting ATPase (P-type)